jgi:hypothetical protein
LLATDTVNWILLQKLEFLLKKCKANKVQNKCHRTPKNWPMQKSCSSNLHEKIKWILQTKVQLRCGEQGMITSPSNHQKGRYTS